MSTRANIMVEGSNVVIYKHYDGYPEGVLPVLIPFLKDFHKDRGMDEEYMVCQIVRAFAVEEGLAGEDDHVKEVDVKLGWGLDVGLRHADIEYLYVVRDGCFVEIRKTTDEFWDRPSIENTVIVKEVSYANNEIAEI